MVKILLIIVILMAVLSRTLTEDVPEFQYPCYVDICTFPTQFCNSDKYERRCSPCSRSICKASNVPLACRYICLKYNELTTTLKPTTVKAAIPQQQQYESLGSDNLASLHLIMSYSAVSTTLLVVVLLAFVAYYVHHKKDSKERRTQFVKYTTEAENGPQDIEENERLMIICPECGQRPRPETQHIRTGHAPPSYTSQCNDANIPRTTPVSQIESSGSSTETINNNNNKSKTQMVKPMTTQTRPSAKKNNLNDNRTRQKSAATIDSETPLLESLMNSQEANDPDHTSVKSSSS